MRDEKRYTIMSGQGISTAEFTAAATDIITSAGHGLTNGTPIVLTTSASDLPAGLATATVYYVIEQATNTFKVSLTAPPFDYTTASVPPSPVPVVDITDAGSGTHTWTEHDIGRNVFCADHRHVKLQVASANSANLTYKVVGSDSDSCPDFSAARSATNEWEYIGIIDRQDGAPIDGDTGITLAGTDDYRQFTVNTDGLRWVNVIITSWTAGDISVDATLYND